MSYMYFHSGRAYFSPAHHAGPVEVSTPFPVACIVQYWEGSYLQASMSYFSRDHIGRVLAASVPDIQCLVIAGVKREKP